MRQRLLHIAVIALVILLPAGCSRTRTISNKILKEIFKESYLANAYYNTPSGQTILYDTLDIYRPILEKYGYGFPDLERTVQEFSKQKSAKLSTIVEAAIKELQEESKYFNERVTLLDTLDARAGRRFCREIVSEPLIEAREIADTALLRIGFPLEEGRYEVSFGFHIDSLDRNNGLRVIYLMTDQEDRTRQVHSQSMAARRKVRHTYSYISPPDARRMSVVIGNYRKEMTTPNLTVDSLQVVYYLPREVALDSIPKLYLPVIPTANVPLPDSLKADRIPLRFDTIRPDSTAAHND